MSQCQLWSFLQGSLDQRKHPGASFKLALEGMGFDVWQGWGLGSEAQASEVRPRERTRTDCVETA